MEQTAVEWLLDALNKQGISLYTPEIIAEAKEMEKEQKIQFANEYSHAVMGGCLLTPTEFYNELNKSE